MIGVRVPASTSNLGAGFDCLGLALDMWLEVRLDEGEGDPEYFGTLEGLSPSEDIILGILKDALPEQRRLRVQSEIPWSELPRVRWNAPRFVHSRADSGSRFRPSA